MDKPNLVSPTDEFTKDNFVLERLMFTTKTNSFMNWVRGQVRTKSIWPMPFGSSCCTLEYTAAMGPRYDLGQKGMDIERFSPCHSDLLIVAGTVTEKMAPLLRSVYEEMTSPKWVIAMGACAASGGSYRTYSVVQGIGHLIPVDVYIPGCPPTPESLIQGIMTIQERIKKRVRSLEIDNG